jgi:predicted RNase H-like nuclease (RuvC/YqgF family)
MKRTLLFGSMVLLSIVGCDTKVSQRDVDAQKREVARLETKVQDLKANRDQEIRDSAVDASQKTEKNFDEEIRDTKKELNEEKQQLVALEERRATEDAMQKQLDEMDRKIDTLEARAAKAEGETKVELEKQVAEFKARHEMMQKNLDELKAASGDTWANVKLSFEKAWNDATTQVNTAYDDDST